VTAITPTSKTAIAAAFIFPAAVCSFLDITLYEGKIPSSWGEANSTEKLRTT
jgi:hypothetical protein